MIKLPKSAQIVITTLQKADFESYAVGGSIRDQLLGKPTNGWDFTTNATPEDLLKIFPDSFYDNQFGTVGIKIYKPAKKSEEKEIEDIYEITPYRKEGTYSDNRHPDHIEWGSSLEEDLSRRDFTINAIAYDGKTIVDPYHGQVDLQNKLIKAVGDPNQRFAEDALRMMRAIRFASELGFVIEDHTLAAIKKHSQLLTRISWERIRDELMRLMATDYAADGILILKSTGILKIILPELDVTFGVEQKSPKRHHIFDVGTHSVLALKFCPSKDPVVRFATLLHDIGKVKTYQKKEDGVITFYNHEVVGTKLTKDICTRLRLSKKQTELISTLVRWHQFTVDERQTDSALRRFIRRVGKDNIDAMLALRIGDRLGGGAQETSWRLELYKSRLEEVQKQPFSISDLHVNGHDIMAEFDIKPGPTIGKVLNQLFNEVEEGKLNNEKELLLQRIRELKLIGIS